MSQGIYPTDGDAFKESREIARWGRDGLEEKVYRQGILRDVYPWNFLTEGQLFRVLTIAEPTTDVGFNGLANFETETLEKWILKDPRHGTLIAIGKGVSLWEVRSSEIAAIRNHLRCAGVIL